MRDILYFFYLSRPLNVLITLLAFGLSAFIALRQKFDFLQDQKFWFGAICLGLISATGYWVNDAFDFKIDRVNKPRKVIVNAHLSVKKVLTAYFCLIILVMAFSIWQMGYLLSAVNFAAIALLFLYAWFLKRTTIIGNIVIASLTALVIYYAALLYRPSMPLIWTIIFAFEVTFLREVVKDMEDIEGDLAFKLQTLPIRAGIQGAKNVLYAAYAVFFLSCYGPIVEGLLVRGHFNWAYLLASIVLVQIPAAWLVWDLRSAAVEKDFARHSKWLKLLILLGMITILFL